MSMAIALDDQTAHERAVQHLQDSFDIHDAHDVPTVTWDPKHHLQGHVEVDGRHLVLIAPRLSDRTPVVLTDDDWDAFHRSQCRSVID